MSVETNRSKFKSHGYFIESLATLIEIQISNSGDAARYRSTTDYQIKGIEIIHGRWQEIRYNKKNNRPYIYKFGKRLYIDNFIRNDYDRP